MPARRFGSEVMVEQITGRKRRTLQKDRLFGKGFPVLSRKAKFYTT